MKPELMELTQRSLTQLLRYDPETGDFSWLIDGRAMKSGARAGSMLNNGYRRVGINGKQYKAHRLAWLYVTGEWPRGQIDHIDGNRANNKFANLREATASMNAQNLHAANKSNKSTKTLGVTKKRDKYQAQIQHNRTGIYLGVFQSKEDAHEAYIEAKRKIHEGCTI